MELWPSAPAKTISNNQKKSGIDSNWVNYPVINHGGLSAATLVKVDGKFEWIAALSSTKGLIRSAREQLKLYPETKPQSPLTTGPPLQQAAEQGAKFLRSNHPDVDVPFDLLKAELRDSEKATEEITQYDPMQGNTMAVMYCLESLRTRSVALAFPTGILSNELNISPFNIRSNGLIFQPRTLPLREFNTPIRQIVTSCPIPPLGFKKEHFMAVRTYGQTHIFDIRHQFTLDRSIPPYALSDLVTFDASDFSGYELMDMAFSRDAPTNLYLMTKRGGVYRCLFREGQHTLSKIIVEEFGENESDMWRIFAGHGPHSGTVASSKQIWKFDTRSPSDITPLLPNITDDRHVLTSACTTHIDHLYSVCTTGQVIWLDDRYPKRPLLGWKHRRDFDRTLSIQNIDLGETSLCLLSSRHVKQTTAITVNKLADGPLQCQMPPSSVETSNFPSLRAPVERVFVRHPNETGPSSFALVELSEQNGVYCRELAYFKNASSMEAQMEETVPRMIDLHWSESVHDLQERVKDLRPDLGNAADREFALTDFSELYEELFGEEVTQARDELENENAESVYGTLETMPDFWQSSETASDQIHTLFDIAFASGTPPLFETRATFLTGSVLDSARGFRARRQNRIPAIQVAKNAAWHFDIRPTLSRITPSVFDDWGEHASGDVTMKEPYRVVREEEMPLVDRFEAEARERLALDLVLAADVYSGVPFRDAIIDKSRKKEEGASVEDREDVLLTQAAERLSLGQGLDTPVPPLPASSPYQQIPQMQFGFLNPVERDPSRHYRTNTSTNSSNSRERTLDNPKHKGTALDSAEEPELPPGVRLLLSEWNIGESPHEYEYEDPYGLDDVNVRGIPALSRARRKGVLKASDEGTGGTSQLTQVPVARAPPTIVAARSVASQPKVNSVGPSRAPAQSQTLTMTNQTQLQTQHSMGSSQPFAMPQTQILPGPFGGRQNVAKKKPPKKRVGGF